MSRIFFGTYILLIINTLKHLFIHLSALIFLLQTGVFPSLSCRNGKKPFGNMPDFIEYCIRIGGGVSIF